MFILALRKGSDLTNSNLRLVKRSSHVVSVLRERFIFQDLDRSALYLGVRHIASVNHFTCLSDEVVGGDLTSRAVLLVGRLHHVSVAHLGVGSLVDVSDVVDLHAAGYFCISLQIQTRIQVDTCVLGMDWGAIGDLCRGWQLLGLRHVAHVKTGGQLAGQGVLFYWIGSRTFLSHFSNSFLILVTFLNSIRKYFNFI